MGLVLGVLGVCYGVAIGCSRCLLGRRYGVVRVFWVFARTLLWGVLGVFQSVVMGLLGCSACLLARCYGVAIECSWCCQNVSKGLLVCSVWVLCGFLLSQVKRLSDILMACVPPSV